MDKTSAASLCRQQNDSTINVLSLTVFLLTVVFLLSFVRSSHGGQPKLRVVASIAPLADFARQVGGDSVEVMLLLPPGISPHTFEPTPKTMQQISKARLFVKIGAGLEFWADRIVSSANRSILFVVCSDSVELLRNDDYGDDHGPGFDPHIWLDPTISAQIVKKIADAFADSQPVHAETYKRNSAEYIGRLEELDREIAEKVQSFSTRTYVTFHPAWNYFSRRYGLTVAGVIEEGPGKEPTPKHLDTILRELQKANTKIIFAEPQFSPKIAEAIAREAGAQVLFLDPVGGQKGRETYIDMMRYNLSIMEKALR